MKLAAVLLSVLWATAFANVLNIEKGKSLLAEDPATAPGQYQNVSKRLERTYEPTGDQKVWYQYGRPFWKDAKNTEQLKEINPTPLAEPKSTDEAVATPMNRVQAQALPLNAKPGQCFTKVILPAKFEWREEKVLVSPEITRSKTLPAQYKSEKKRVLVSEQSEQLIPQPAIYKTVDKKVLFSEETEKLVKVPAEYKTVTKKIKVRDAVLEWKKGDQPGQTGENDALCLVKTPAVYKTVSEEVVVKAESFKKVKTPALYKVVKVNVIDRPATVKKVVLPAKYEEIVVKTLIAPAKKISYTIPAKFKDVTKRVRVAHSTTEWRQVLCKTNASKPTIRRVQSALKKAGFNPGPVDGHLGKDTAAAVRNYQLKYGIPTGGLTLETVEALNVKK